MRLSRPFRFSTASLAPAQQFDAVRALGEPSLELSPIGGVAPPRFDAEVTTWALGPFALHRVQADGLDSRRTASQIRRDQMDHLGLSLLHAGRLRARSAEGSEAEQGLGQLHLFPVGAPHDLRRSRVDWTMLFIARDALPEVAEVMDTGVPRAVPGALAGLLADHLRALHARLPTLTEAELPRLVQGTLGLIGATFGGSDAREAARPQIEAAQRARVMRLIRQNLASVRLDPDRLCQLSGISRSQLYRVFEADGGVARAIQAERLRFARRALADPAERRSIAQIAEAAGFAEPSAFGRAFRRQFGCTPGEHRRLGDAVQPFAAAAAAAEPASYTELLRRLRA